MIGMPWDASDLAIAGFADAGRLKAGDVPFGVDTPIQSSVGLGVMTSVPSGSRRAFRVDFVFPLSPGAERNFELRLSSTNAVRQFWREPDDVAVRKCSSPLVGLVGRWSGPHAPTRPGKSPSYQGFPGEWSGWSGKK